MSGASFPILPPGTALLPGGLYTSYGAVLISVIFSGYLLGILTVQIYLYFNYAFEDPKWLKYIILFVGTLDVAQFAACADFLWWYIVANWGNVDSLAIIRPSFGVQTIIGSTVIFTVELMFLRRVWILSKQSWISTVPVLLLICVQYAFALVGGASGVTVEPFAAAVGGKFSTPTVIVWLGSGVAADCLLAGLLIYHLSRNKTGFQRTDGIVKKLIYFTMNTCLLTTVFAIINIICFFAMRSNFIHVAFNMLLCKLFTNSLMASLNVRRGFRRDDTDNSITARSNTLGISVRSQREVHLDASHPTIDIRYPSESEETELKNLNRKPGDMVSTYKF